VTEKTIEQDIAGDNNRNAGNDYTEINLTIINIKVEVTNITVCADEKNLRDFEEEAEFIERFKFDANAEQRYQVLQLKQQLGLTDLNIRLLKRSGALSLPKDKPVKLHSDWIGYLACIILLALSGFVIFLLSSLIFIRGTNLPMQVVIVSGLAAIYWLFCRDLYRLSIKPAIILRDYGIGLGDTFILPSQ